MDSTLAVGPSSARRTGRYRFSAACVLPAVAASVPALRRLARHAACRWDLPEATTEALCLIVTELATNAVRHSGSADVTLLLCLGDDSLTVRVKDSGSWRPRMEPVGARDVNQVSGGPTCGGRGLPIVEAYAADCTVLPSVDGTTVTCELLLPASCSPPRGRTVREPVLPVG